MNQSSSRPSHSSADRVLVLACGNPARLDDGLGPALARMLESDALPNVTVDVDYQWNVEHAYDLAHYPVAVLVDAASQGPEPLFVREVQPASGLMFSSHGMTPGALLWLAQEHFGAKTTLYLVGIRGYVFDGFGETLSPRAEHNLGLAHQLLSAILSPLDLESFRRHARDFPPGAVSVESADCCRHAAPPPPPELTVESQHPCGEPSDAEKTLVP